MSLLMLKKKAHLTLSEHTVLHIVEVNGKRLAIMKSHSNFIADSCDHVCCSIVQIKD